MQDVERTGRDAIARLPSEIAEFLPPDLTLSHEEERAEGNYRLWILRSAGGGLLDFAKAKRKGLDHHDLPPTALESVLRRVPSIEPGKPQGRCRFTHMPSAGGGEIQIRELVTDRGWFASVEHVKF